MIILLGREQHVTILQTSRICRSNIIILISICAPLGSIVNFYEKLTDLSPKNSNMSVNCEKRQSPGGDCHDLWGAEFLGSPCHHRVLKPPGGGSSDIFGKDGSQEPSVAALRHKKAQQSSSIVLSDDMPAPIENGHNNKQGTCNERLFGPTLELNGTNSVAKMNGNGEILTNGKDHTDAPKTNGVPMTNGKSAPEAPKLAPSNAAPRQRVPPGGFSSGLW